MPGRFPAAPARPAPRSAVRPPAPLAPLERQAGAVERRRRGEIRAAGGLRLRVAAREGVGGDVEIAGRLLEIAEIVQGRGDQPRIAARRGRRLRPLERARGRPLLSGGEVRLAQQAIERGRARRILARRLSAARSASNRSSASPMRPSAQIGLGLAQTVVERVGLRRPARAAAATNSGNSRPNNPLRQSAGAPTMPHPSASARSRPAAPARAQAPVNTGGRFSRKARRPSM